MNAHKFIGDMKTEMKKHPVIKKHIDKMVKEGLEEDVAMEYMIYMFLMRYKK